MKTLLFAVCVALGVAQVFAKVSPPQDAYWLGSNTATLTTSGGKLVTNGYDLTTLSISDATLWVSTSSTITTLSATNCTIFVDFWGEVKSASLINCTVYTAAYAKLTVSSSTGSTFQSNLDFNKFVIEAPAASAGWLYVTPSGWSYHPASDQWVYILNTWYWGQNTGWDRLFD